MATSRAASAADYLAELPDETRRTLADVRDVILRHLPAGYQETMGFGMIAYTIPLERYPTTYNGQPLMYASLGAQKNYCALYLMSAYGDPQESTWLAQEFKRAGKKLDMGKSCLRFRSAEDLPLDAIGQFIARTTPEEFIARYEATRAETKRPVKATARKPAPRSKV